MDGMQMYTVLSQEKTTSPYFQGVYSRDTLPPLQENMCAIVNSDDSSQPGTHWLALFVNDKRELEFYDSFGQPPVFYNISTTTYLDVLWNSKVFQSPTSNVCGQYCIYFLFKRSQGYSMHYILNQLYINDFQMYQFVKKRYGVRFVFRK
nr:TPA_asm: adenain [Nephila orb-weaver spider adintovirus]